MRYDQTRAKAAQELLRMATNGPHFSPVAGNRALTPKEATESYRLWSESWILPLLRRLVPELREGPDGQPRA